MKQVTITTGKATIVAVDLPDGYSVENIRSVEAMQPFKAKCIGSPSQLTEEQWNGIVDLHFMDGHRSYSVYRDYRHDDNSVTWLDTATESGLSLLKANGVDESWSNPQIFIKL